MKQTIKFSENVKVLNHLGDITFEAKAGDVVELIATSATRWVRRGKAKIVADKKPEPVKAIKAAPKKKATPVADEVKADKK